MNEFAKARRLMAKYLHEDDGLRQGYVANVAMLLHDRHGIKNTEKRNKAAEEILDLIFGKDYEETKSNSGSTPRYMAPMRGES